MFNRLYLGFYRNYGFKSLGKSYAVCIFDVSSYLEASFFGTDTVVDKSSDILYLGIFQIAFILNSGNISLLLGISAAKGYPYPAPHANNTG